MHDHWRGADVGVDFELSEVFEAESADDGRELGGCLVLLLCRRSIDDKDGVRPEALCLQLVEAFAFEEGLSTCEQDAVTLP